jgi:release factor glutamine methyltransferase
MPTLSILGTKQKIAALLKSGGIDEPVREAAYILSHALKVTRAQLLSLDEITAAQDVIARIDEMARRRALREPLARIIGHKEFWGMDFGLNAHTLVPRPDTETLVETVLKARSDRDGDYHILDLGTGSGCILLALLSEYKRAAGIGADLAPEAVAQAAANAASLKLDTRARFVESDWLQNVEGDFDIIVSNPPYIADGKIFTLDAEVRKHDPHLALFAGIDGLEAYRLLVPAALARLKPGGLLALEIGKGQGDAVAALARAAGASDITFTPDLAGIDRVVTIQA